MNDWWFSLEDFAGFASFHPDANVYGVIAAMANARLKAEREKAQVVYGQHENGSWHGKLASCDTQKARLEGVEEIEQ